MEREIVIAPLFTKICETEELEVLIPTRIIFGIVDDEDYSFFDVISQNVYHNVNFYSEEGEYSGFDDIKSLKWLLDNFPDLNLFEAVHAYLNELRKNVYFFKLDSGKVEDFLLKSMPVEEFNKKFELIIKYPVIPFNLNDIDINNVQEEYNKFVKQQEQDVTSSVLPNFTDVYNEITKHIMCQNVQIKRLLTAIYKNIIFEKKQLKSNIFIYGPTGVGKTAMLSKISELLGLPMVIEDSTSFTVAGYVGKSCDDALRHLYEKANGNLELAQHGILVFDEIDKKCKKNGSDSGTIAFEGVLHSLLKIIEGSVLEVEINHHTDEKILFDTSNLIVIVSGAFEDLLKNEKNNLPIGFNQNVQSNNILNLSGDMTENFVKYGMAREFIGRFNTFIKLNDLTKDDLKNILINSDSSALKIYLQQLKEYGVNICVTDELIDKICELAILKHTGARALNNIVNEIFEDILCKLFSNSDIKSNIILDKDVISEDKKIVLKNTVQGS